MGHMRSVACISLMLVSACANSNLDERLDALERTALVVRSQEVKLALLEDRVAELSTEVMARRAPEDMTVSVARSVLPAPASPRKPASPPVDPAKTSPLNPAPAAQPSLQAQRAGDARLRAASSGEQQQYARALALYEAGKYQEALELFNAFLLAYPSGALAPNAGYWLGECEYGLKRYDRAILAFKNVVGRYPKHPKAAASMLKSGYAYERLGDKDNARFYLNALLEDFPESEPAALARQKLRSLGS